MRLIEDLAPLDPHLGLACDEALFESVRAGGSSIVRLWVNDRAVVIGRSQAIVSEVDVDAAREERIPVLRRITGGGAVYHYPGNLNVTVAVSAGTAGGSVRGIFAHWGGAVCDGLATIVPGTTIDGTRIGVFGRKLGGAAQLRRGGAVLFHTTVLVVPSARPIERLLRAHRPDYATERVPSRPDETITLCEAAGRPVELAEVAAAVRRGLARRGKLEADRISAREAACARDLVAAKYGKAAWNASR